jgi:putative ABC transport system ATP-binding protein
MSLVESPPHAAPVTSPARDDATTSQPIIELRNVHKYYTLGAKRLHVLKGIALQIPRGQYVAIMGSSGSGKSTLLNLLGLLDTVDSGGYIRAGEDVARLKDDQLAKHRNARIGFIFQSFNLFPQLDVLGNIEVPMVYQNMPLQKRRARAKELAEAVGLGHRLGHRPRQLSGGEMQRTAIARALANDPPLLLADEPTGNLDETTGNEILALFDKLVANGQTMVLVTHNPAYKDRVHRTLRMANGELAG